MPGYVTQELLVSIIITTTIIIIVPSLLFIFFLSLLQLSSSSPSVELVSLLTLSSFLCKVLRHSLHIMQNSVFLLVTVVSLSFVVTIAIINSTPIIIIISK